VKIVLATADTNRQLSLGLLLSEEPSVTIAGIASETESLFSLIKFAYPDVVIADWDLPGRPLSVLLEKACKNGDKPKWIILGPSARVKKEALLAGASAFVVRGDPPEVLLNAFRDTRALLAAPTNDLSVITK